MARRCARLALATLAVMLMLSGGWFATPQVGAAEHCFRETGFCVQGRFLEYWQANGGLERNGFPLSAERREVLEDGKEYTVQYFERVRLEYHPENAAPYDVLLGQFGRRILREEYVVDRRAYDGAVSPTEPKEGQVYFAETGHNLGGRFLAYWQANGGLAQFGYPISEVRYDNIDGQGYETQFFERARFEYHPENAGTPYEVQLGQFGRRIMSENALLGDDFARLFLTDERVQVKLGAPVSAAMRSNGATQPFEYGRMLYASEAPPGWLIRGGRLDRDEYVKTAAGASAQRADTVPTIYVLCGNAEQGRLVTNIVERTAFFQDTWDESEPAGGGPGPKPGLYEPKRGFGKIWREHFPGGGMSGPEPCPGYATTADETGFSIAVQYFMGGAMLLSDTPEGRYIYVLTIGHYSNGSPQVGTYQRYPVE
jgi:hypothetical protein